MEGMTEKPRKKPRLEEIYTLSGNLPFVIVEDILSRLPPKSLLRFRAVSRSWDVTISDPGLVATHLQRTKNSGLQNLFISDSRRPREFQVTKFENQKFQMVSALEYPREIPYEVRSMCFCDGLLLLSGAYDDPNTYALWNPSTRAHTKFSCPYPLPGSPRLHGICHDPLVNDYKVVISDTRHYAIFHCRNNYWSQMRGVDEFSCDVFDNFAAIKFSAAVPFDGDIYWTVNKVPREEPTHSRYEIVRFDSRDEKLYKLSKPQCEEGIHSAYLTTLGGNLLLFLHFGQNHMFVMSKVGHQHSWMKLRLPLPFSGVCAYPTCLASKDEIIYEVFDMEYDVLYNHRKKTFTEIPKISGRIYYQQVPYIDNLFFISQCNRAHKRE